jgi:hypothetical protein
MKINFEIGCYIQYISKIISYINDDNQIKIKKFFYIKKLNYIYYLTSALNQFFQIYDKILILLKILEKLMIMRYFLKLS